MNAPEISIFLDTNCLEVWDGKNVLHLSKLTVPNEFYILWRFIAENNLSDKVELCISEITWAEIKEHLFKCYKETHSALENDISTHKNRLGSLLDINYSTTYASEREYLEHIETITTEFIRSYPCKIINYPRSIQFLEDLVKRAVRTQTPFCEAGSNRKKYTDAGFKDALIAETISLYCGENKTFAIFITKDKDFGKATGQSIEIMDAIDKAREYLLRKYELKDEDQIKLLLENSDYLQEKIVSETGNPYDKSELNFRVNKVEKSGESNLFKVDSKCVINETQYIISFDYDRVGNDISEIIYKQQNE